MTYLDSIILGITEGLTEFLPISSTGHLILMSGVLGLSQTDFLKSFEIAIQLGSILAVVVWYWRSFLDVEVLKRLAVAFIPTGIIGLVLYKLIKEFLIGNTVVVVWALLLGGVAIIAIEYFHTKQESTASDVTVISYWQSFLLGTAQALAVIPGVSRSGSTVMGGLLLGIPRTVLLTFSFLLAVPTMLMATSYDIYKNPEILSVSQLPLLATGFVTAFIVALVVIRYALSYIKHHSFVAFGVYRIILALVFLLVVL